MRKIDLDALEPVNGGQNAGELTLEQRQAMTKRADDNARAMDRPVGLWERVFGASRPPRPKREPSRPGSVQPQLVDDED
jgi:hypothetical protein